MTLIVEVPPGRAAEREWVCEVVLGELLGLPHVVRAAERRDVSIRPVDAPAGAALVLPDVLLGTPACDWLAPASAPAPPLPRWDAAADLPELGALSPLPVLFPGPPGAPVLDAAPPDIRLGADLLGGAFFLLSRYEELLPGPRDAHGRFPAAASLAAREGFLERPLVNEYADVLFALLARLAPRLGRRSWAHRVTVTHDVDFPRVVNGQVLARVARSAAGDVVRRRSPGLAARRLRAWSDARAGRFDRDPAHTFPFLLELTERRGLTGTYFFMTRPSPDGGYRLDDPWVRRLMREIAARGHEIGLHPSYETWRDPELTARELSALRAAAEDDGVRQDRWGARQHYLRWENPVTWQNYEDAGLAYDSSLCFADRSGFRCGICHPYRAFNLRSGRALAVWERPLQVMDQSLLLYMGLDAAGAVATSRALARATRRHGGEFVLLWHNTSLLTAAERALYVRVIDAVTA